MNYIRATRMPMNNSSTYRILLIAYEPDQEARLRRYADALALARGAVVWVLNAPPESWLDKARALGQSQTFHILVTGWYRDVNKMRTLALISEEMNLETVIVKDWANETIERLLVTTSGGAHALASGGANRKHILIEHHIG